MIKNVSDLLALFIEAERKVVDEFDMPHMPTLGEAYEAIANSGIEQEFVLPPGLDLRVVTGFIDGIPNQIDGMLVKGEGRPYARTGKFFYPIEQVLCVLEVKKTLTKADLVDGINHLAGVQRLFKAKFVEKLNSGEAYDLSPAGPSFEKITGRAAPRSDAALDALPVEDRLLYLTLGQQIYAPVTVLLGFDGHTTEKGIREAMAEIVSSNEGADSNVSPELLPSLITSGNFSLIKCTGRPYLAWGANREWVLLSSARENIARILLEFLWTKISSFCDVSMPFGMDMDQENLKELIVARGTEKDGRFGFEVRLFNYKERELKRPDILSWKPEKISAAAIAIAEFLGTYGGVLEFEDSLAEYIENKYGKSFNLAIEELLDTGAFSKSKNSLKMVENIVTVASFDDGTGYVDSDSSRLRAWCMEEGLDPYYMQILRVS